MSQETREERIFRDYRTLKRTCKFAYIDLNVLFLQLATKWKMKVRTIKDVVNSFKPDHVVTPKYERLNNGMTKTLLKLGFVEGEFVEGYGSASANPARYGVSFSHPDYPAYVVIFPNLTYHYLVKGGYSDYIDYTNKNDLKAELQRGCPSMQPLFRAYKVGRALNESDNGKQEEKESGS